MKTIPLWAWLLIGVVVLGSGGYVATTQLTRGYRNKNPGNIRAGGSKWQGMTGQDADGFVIFTTDHFGLRALARLLLNYERNYGLRTVRAIISKYAPNNENDTAAYVHAVSKKLGVEPDAGIMVATRLPELMEAIVAHENYVNKYSRDEIQAAIRAA